MAELKTKPTDQSVERFIDKVADEQQRDDCRKLVAIMRQITKAEPKLWGGSMICFGTYRCRTASGRECDWFLTGFAARKSNLSIYVTSGFGEYDGLLTRLGPHSLGKSCLYIKRLADIHLPTLKTLVRSCVKRVKRTS